MAPPVIVAPTPCCRPRLELTPPLVGERKETDRRLAGRDPFERELFARLLCECGDCQRLPMSTCACSWADDVRTDLRASLAEGKTPLEIQEAYREKYGPQSISVPADEGLDRLLWAVPFAAIGLMAVQLVRWGRRWSKNKVATAGAPVTAAQTAQVSAYDAEIEREIKRMDEDA
jgi:cytochrome c-type biogenesis protein CcmH/NrfF